MAAVDAQVCDDLQAIRALVRLWDRLQGPGITTVFGSSPWALAAWRHLPLLGDPLVIAAFINRKLVGLLPLAVVPRPNGGRLLRWAGSPLTDKCDALVASGQQDVAVDSLLRGVRSVLDVRDALHLGELDCDGLLAAALSHPDLRGTYGLILKRRKGDASPIVRMERDGTPDTRWPSARQRQWDNRRRWLGRQGSLRFIRHASADDLANEIPAFVRRRLDRWSQRGRLHELPDVEREEGFEDFLTQCCVQLARRGHCYLTHLVLDDAPIASDLYFRCVGVDLLYMRTYDPHWSGASPGHLLFQDSAAIAFSEGVKAIELGRGDEPYKYRLGAVDATLLDVHITVAQGDRRAVLRQRPRARPLD